MMLSDKLSKVFASMNPCSVVACNASIPLFMSAKPLFRRFCAGVSKPVTEVEQMKREMKTRLRLYVTKFERYFHIVACTLDNIYVQLFYERDCALFINFD